MGNSGSAPIIDTSIFATKTQLDDIKSDLEAYAKKADLQKLETVVNTKISVDDAQNIRTDLTASTVDILKTQGMFCADGSAICTIPSGKSLEVSKVGIGNWNLRTDALDLNQIHVTTKTKPDEVIRTFT